MTLTYSRYIELLRSLIATPSVSRHEDETASLLFSYLEEHGAAPSRIHNNVYAFSGGFDPSRPTLLLNSHHDTVAPAASYTRNPYDATVESGRLYGLGSNDAGASLVSLVEVFLRLHQTPLPINLLLALTAEEEMGGEKGMRAFLPEMERLGVKISAAIVGEPTGMQPAVAERGLVVLDCVTSGVSGHAARNEGENALYRAIDDINRLRSLELPVISPVLGGLHLNVTMIEAGRAHNVIPDSCHWVVDVRTVDTCPNEETVSLLRGAVSPYTELTPRSTRVRPSVIERSHPLVKECMALGLEPFVSPTTSDMSLMYHFPSLKIGPGQSARSHSADEFVCLDEIERAIPVYEKIITSLNETLEQGL
ncbi:MAG: M20/M25/M40 family metallo-hydrolase [Muribaculaceae bacterium]|nr:M20/M25/M40 family metallo-hydrolase [Muribaculaceae bacterium]